MSSSTSLSSSAELKLKIARGEDRQPEIFASVRGEGEDIGRPAVFVRLSLCNLHCAWCDTDYTWNWQGTPFVHQRDSEPGYAKYRMEEEIAELSPAEVVALIAGHDCQEVVVTGGEPLVQQHGLIPLAEQLQAAQYHLEIETNGTIVPVPELDRHIARYNVSPKLGNSGNRAEQALRGDALRFFAGCPRAIFKFVVSGLEDVQQVSALVAQHQIPRSQAFLMPEGTDSHTLRTRSLWIVEACQREHFRFSDRLHVHLYGNHRGV